MPEPGPIEDDMPDPHERDLQRRSSTPAVGIWVILALILIAGAAVYVLSSL